MAAGPEDVRAAQRLRFRCFIEGRGAALVGMRAEGLEGDDLDTLCEHMLIEDRRSGDLVCCFRMLPLSNGSEIAKSYSARYYDLSALAAYPQPMVEMGRFCVHPDHRDPDVLRAAWGAMTRYVERHEVGLLFGCSSFHGTDADGYMDAFTLLAERHIAPKRWLPRVKAPKVFRFGKLPRLRRPDMKLAMRHMPPLLRTYLTMGGWVSDHAVVDHDLNTLHVFTGLEIDRVPANRVRLLRDA
jgi:putative hemolysin